MCRLSSTELSQCAESTVTDGNCVPVNAMVVPYSKLVLLNKPVLKSPAEVNEIIPKSMKYSE